MKKISLIAAMLAFTFAGFAQKYDDVKTALLLPGKFAQAKQAFDKNSANEKFYSKPEGYLLKSLVYSYMLNDSAYINDQDKNREETYNAFMKYKEMDPSMKLLDDLQYKNVPYYLYASYYNGGVADINSKKYESAYNKFKSTVDLSDILINKKIQLHGPIDTMANYYAGALSDQLQKSDDVIKYFGRLADAKVKDSSFMGVYSSLMRVYANKNDNANFDKYKGIGKSLYPNSEYFTYNMLDYAMSGSSDFNSKIKSIESVISNNPNETKNYLLLAQTIFDTIHSQKEGATKPANYSELSDKMVNALKKVVSITPDDYNSYAVLGDHFTFESEAIKDSMITVERNIEKKGSKATAAEKQAYNQIKSRYTSVFDKASENYLKAADILGKKGTLDNMTKRTYRLIAGRLIDYYSYMREGKSGADLNKFVNLESKYTKLYDSLK